MYLDLQITTIRFCTYFDNTYSWYYIIKMVFFKIEIYLALIFYGLSPNPYAPSNEEEKNYTNCSWRKIYKIPDQYSPKLKRSSKTRKLWETFQQREALGDLMTKSDVVSYTEHKRASDTIYFSR